MANIEEKGVLNYSTEDINTAIKRALEADQGLKGPKGDQGPRGIPGARGPRGYVQLDSNIQANASWISSDSALSVTATSDSSEDGKTLVFNFGIPSTTTISQVITAKDTSTGNNFVTIETKDRTGNTKQYSFTVEKGDKGDRGEPGGYYRTLVLRPDTLQADLKNFSQNLEEEEGVKESDICRGQLFVQHGNVGSQTGFSISYFGRIYTGSIYSNRFGLIVEVKSITSAGEVAYKNFFIEDETSLSNFLKQVGSIATKDKLLITEVSDKGWDTVGMLASGSTDPRDYQFTLKIYIDHEV